MKGGLLLNKFFKGIGFYLVIFIIIVGIVQFSGKPTQQVETMEFSKVYRELENENVSRLYFIKDTAVEGTIKVQIQSLDHMCQKRLWVIN